jgi:hypothetical protein
VVLVHSFIDCHTFPHFLAYLKFCNSAYTFLAGCVCCVVRQDRLAHYTCLPARGGILGSDCLLACGRAFGLRRTAYVYTRRVQVTTIFPAACWVYCLFTGRMIAARAGAFSCLYTYTYIYPVFCIHRYSWFLLHYRLHPRTLLSSQFNIPPSHRCSQVSQHHDLSFPHYSFSDTSFSFYQIIFVLPCLLLLACYLVIHDTC